jgi:hypothetical protein
MPKDVRRDMLGGDRRTIDSCLVDMLVEDVLDVGPYQRTIARIEKHLWRGDITAIRQAGTKRGPNRSANSKSNPSATLCVNAWASTRR